VPSPAGNQCRLDDVEETRSHDPAEEEPMGTRRQTKTALAVLVALLMATASACSSSSANSSARSSGSSSTRETTAPPYTFVDPSRGLAVPFTADNGSLTVEPGPPPRRVSDAEAEQLVSRALTGAQALAPAASIYPSGPFPGRVTMAAGLGAPPIRDEAEWVLRLAPSPVAASCPMEGVPPSTPWASHLLLALVDSSKTVTFYDGAGTGICQPSTKPSATIAR
jgi:hypothetical protein